MSYVIIMVYLYIVMEIIKSVFRTQNNKSTDSHKSNSIKQASVKNKHVDVNKSMADTSHQWAMEDRQNDFLAKQLREERQKKVDIDSMFQLRQSHFNNCDAEYIKSQYR